MEIFGIHLLGLNHATLEKLAMTIGVIVVGFAVRALFYFVPALRQGRSKKRIWVVKSLRLLVGALCALVVLSIWFDNPSRLATFSGLIAAGFAVASQNAILSAVGYFVIVFGKVFDIGDRIEINDVRGDVLDVGLFKTTIMEMGVPERLVPDPNHWVRSRQYTGRIVTIANSDIFSKPTFNYSREFSFLWEELQVPLHYKVDLEAAEQIVLDAARRATESVVAEAKLELQKLEKRFLIHSGDLEPQSYVRLTDNWIELTVRFVVKTHGTRQIKSQMSREILKKFREQGIEVASSTSEVTITGAPKIEIDSAPSGAAH